MIRLDNFLLTFTLLLSPFKLSGFNNIALNCFFNSGTQIMFSNPFIHHLHFQIYKKVHSPHSPKIKKSAYDAADAFINLLPDYYTGNTVGRSHNVKSDKNLEYYLRELYKDEGLVYGDEGDTMDPILEYFHLFKTLAPKSITKNFMNYSVAHVTYDKQPSKNFVTVTSNDLNVVWLDNKHVKEIENGGKFRFDMFIDRLKDYLHFEKNFFVIFGSNMIKYMTEEFMRQMFNFEVEVLNWRGVPVKVGMSLHAFDKSAADLRTGVAIHYWAYVFKNNKWYVGNDSSLNEVGDIKKEISSFRHHIFRFNINYIKRK